jgi:ParB family chromosome partitioning protein
MNDKNEKNIRSQIIELNSIRDNILRLDFFSESYLQELTNSLQKDGLLEPLLIHQNNISGIYTILNGHYRIRALRRLRVKESDCMIMNCDDESATSHYLASFIRKTSVTALEEGHIITGLIEKGYAMETVGKMWGKSISWISRRVKLLKDLDVDAKKELSKGSIFPRVAQELARLPQGKDQKRVLKLVKEQKLTKDETAELVTRWIIADVDKRKQIENEFGQKQVPIKKIHIESPEVFLKNLVKQCSKTLENLIENMEQIKNLQKIWSWEESYKLCILWKHFSNVLESINCEKRNLL